MNRAGHVRLGLAASAVTSVALAGPPLHWAVGAGLAVASCQGPTSPDVDQVWRWLGPHRGPTHDVVWPVLAAAVMTLGAPWWCWYLLAGWVSHLVGDVLVGEAPMGVPVCGVVRVGLGALTPGTWLLRTGGVVEWVVSWGAVLATGYALLHPLGPFSR
jgi:hypothetical protein